MQWLTIPQIKRRSKTAKGALKVSYEHWNQLYTATAKELRAALKEDCNINTSDYCGLCMYHTDKYRSRNCNRCVFTPYCPRPISSPLWGKAADALRQWRYGNKLQNWYDWKRACKAVRDKLKSLIEE